MKRVICSLCGFDADGFDAPDAAGTLASLPQRWSWLLEDLEIRFLGAARADHTSVAGLAASTVEVLGAAEKPVLTGLAGDWPALLELMQSLAAAAHSRVLHGSDPPPLELVHTTTHALSAAGRSLRASGAFDGADGNGPGMVAGLFTSDGGVPKLPVAGAEVGPRGVKGDRQADRRHHGRPFQALCLWSLDVIDALRAEGHPVAMGQAGENISVSGLEWARLRPGMRLAIGDVVAEITAYATPCSKNAAWFADRDFRRMAHERHPGWSRLYASVLRSGRIATGDAVIVEPD